MIHDEPIKWVAMPMWEVWVFRLVFVAFVGVFVAQILARGRLLAAAPDNLSMADLPARIRRFVTEVIFQSKVIRAKPVVGVAHLFVFWGFVAFGGYTLGELLLGLGIADVTHAWAFHVYRWLLLPFCLAVIVGTLALLVRRVVLRPPALGARLSLESVLIGAFIVILMVTFVFDLRLPPGPWARVNWWTHMVVILTFLALIPNSKHLHLLLSPATVFLRSSVLGDVPNLDFEKEEVGFEVVNDLPRKQVLDAFTCVECGRCQENCPAHATGKLLNPKRLILQNEEALLAGKGGVKLGELYDEGVLWQCTTCGACEDLCPVGVEHLPLIIGARRGLVSNGEAPAYMASVYNHLERRGNIWGLGYDQRERFIKAAGVERFDPAKHEYLIWLGCAGAFEADFQRSLRSLFAILTSKGVSFGVLEKERCTGDVAKRTGNEYAFQDLARQNIELLSAASAKKIVTSCPHCLKTLGADYPSLGLEAKVVHSSVLVDELTRGLQLPATDRVTFHDPCYLGRYAKHDEEPRALLRRVGAEVVEPERNRQNPFCCGAGGGLLFEEHESGKRISQERLEQLQATGADTIVMACPFCSIMLRGAQASTNAPAQMVDLMTYVESKLSPVPASAAGASPTTPS